MNVILGALVRRIKQRAYLDTDEEIARWIEEYCEQSNSHKHGVSGKRPDCNCINGSLLLHDLFQVAGVKNEDGMSVIEYLDKPNGGSVAYIRHDAMVKKLNSLLAACATAKGEQRKD